MSSQAPSPLLSVLVTNWNGERILRDCLRSITKETSRISYELIVVDDASTDASAEMVRREFPGARLIVNPLNVGYVRANNIGVKEAKGKYVILLNSDTLIRDNALKVLTDYMESNESVAVCGGWLITPDAKSQVSFGSYPSFLEALTGFLFLNDFFPLLRLPNRGVRPDPSYREPADVGYITGADICIRMSVIKNIGLFDERFTAYCEETDFCYRVKHEAHYDVRFVPAASIVHLEGSSYNKLGKRKTRIYFRSTHLFLAKHHGELYSFCTRLVYCGMHLLKCISRSVAWLIGPHARREETGNRILDSLYAVRYSLFPPSSEHAQ